VGPPPVKLGGVGRPWAPQKHKPEKGKKSRGVISRGNGGAGTKQQQDTDRRVMVSAEKGLGVSKNQKKFQVLYIDPR